MKPIPDLAISASLASISYFLFRAVWENPVVDFGSKILFIIEATVRAGQFCIAMLILITLVLKAVSGLSIAQQKK